MTKQSAIFVLTASVFLLAAVAYPQSRAPMPPSPAMPQPPVITALHLPRQPELEPRHSQCLLLARTFIPGLAPHTSMGLIGQRSSSTQRF
jgi:hypothetical protein